MAGGKIENALGTNTSCQGVLKSDGNLRLDGVFEGRIETAGNVIIGTAARVAADIVAHAVQVWGVVRGDITAHGRLEILAGGQVWGNVHADSLSIDGGGVLHGHCAVINSAAEAVTVLPPGPAPMPLPDGTAAGIMAPGLATASSGPTQVWDADPLQPMHDAVTRAATRLALLRAAWGQWLKTR